MTTVGIRELKQQASELVRQVREERRTVQITYRGKVVALLAPVEASAATGQDQAWSALDQLAAEIGARWPEGVSAADAVSEGRQ